MDPEKPREANGRHENHGLFAPVQAQLGFWSQTLLSSAVTRPPGWLYTAFRPPALAW